MKQTSAPVVALLDSANEEPGLTLAAWEAQARGSSLVVVRKLPAALSAAADDGLLVIGHQPGGHRRTWLPDARELAREWPGPVLVVPASWHGNAELTGAPVVLGVSVGTGADDVVGFAMVEAAMRSTSVRAIHVRPPWCPGSGRGELPNQPGGHGSAEQLLDDALMRWSDKYPEITVDALVRVGIDPVITLAAASHSAAMIVVGAGVADTASSAGIPYALLSRAVCPVAIVRA